MKVLFLDIDGVLNSSRTAVAHNGYPHLFTAKHMVMFDQTALALVQNLCAVANVMVVVSSSWRIGRTVEELLEGLNLPVIDKTPLLSSNRGDEIAAWLSKRPDVTHYAILDDDSDMNPDQMQNFVQTKHDEGLSFQNYRQLCGIFGISEYDRPDFIQVEVESEREAAEV